MRLGQHSEPNEAQSLLFVLLVTLLGLVLRLYGIECGLPSDRHPYYSYHPDEVLSLIRAAWLHEGKITSIHFIYGGTLYFTILDSLLFFAELLGGFVGRANAIANAVLLGRFFMTWAAVLTILIVYETGRGLFDKRVGLLAALLLSISPAHIVPAQQLRVDVLGALCAILILFLAARIPGSQGLQRLRYIILCGLTVGAATALRFPLALCLMIPVGGLFASTNALQVPRLVQVPFIRQLVWLVGSVFLGYLIASPHSLLYFTEFINGLVVQWGYQTGVFVDAFENGPGIYQYGWRMMSQALGYPVYALAIGGLVFSAIRRTRADWLILPFVVLYFCSLTFASWVVIRYLIALLPFLMLLGARWAFYLVDRFTHQRALVYCGLTLAVLWSLLSDLAYLRVVAHEEDIRDLASRWIEKSVEPGASVVTVGTYEGDVFLNPPIPVGIKQLNFVLHKDKNPSVEKIDGDYLVINEGIFRDLDRLGRRHPVKGYREFYEELSRSNFRLIKEFKYPMKVLGLDFSSSFRSYDYMVINPGIRIYKRSRQG